jgi:hypothetical protein
MDEFNKTNHKGAKEEKKEGISWGRFGVVSGVV